jgi:hypothetical protein
MNGLELCFGPLHFLRFRLLRLMSPVMDAAFRYSNAAATSS